MGTATITSKGQVTIPKVIRNSLHLHRGDKLEFIVTQDGDALIRPVTKKVEDVFGRLYKPGRKTVSVRKMDSTIRKRIRERFK